MRHTLDENKAEKIRHEVYEDYAKRPHERYTDKQIEIKLVQQGYEQALKDTRSGIYASKREMNKI